MSKEIDKKRTFRELSEKEQQECKDLYMDYCSVSEIARKYNVSRTGMSYHANKYWNDEREMTKAALFSQFTDTKRTNFIKMSQSAIQIITKSLQALAQRGAPPTVQEAEKATKILESLDKITRLDDGNPTDIVAEKPMSFKDIDAIAQMNPFNTKEIEDANFKEITDESTDNSDGSDKPLS